MSGSTKTKRVYITLSYQNVCPHLVIKASSIVSKHIGLKESHKLEDVTHVQNMSKIFWSVHLSLMVGYHD